MFLDELAGTFAEEMANIREGRFTLPAWMEDIRERAEVNGLVFEDLATQSLKIVRGPHALRLVLSRSAMETIEETCASPTLVAAARRSVVLPHPRLWIEWRLNGEAAGTGFVSDPDAEGIAGDGMTLVRRANGQMHGNAFKFDMRAPTFIRWSRHAIGADLPHAARLLENLATGLSALWASPRMIEVERVETPPRLAAARAKRRAPALSDYSVVHLSKSAASIRHSDTATGGETARRRGHRVRGHLRLLGTGRVVPVRPHERGDRDRSMSGNVRVVG